MSHKSENANTSHRLEIILMALVVGILLVGGIFINRFRVSSQSVNTAELDLDAMKDMSPNKIHGVTDSYGGVDYQMNSYDELQDSLGIHLLDGKLVNHEKADIQGHTDNKDYHSIVIDPFTDDKNGSLKMSISIKCSSNQKEEGLLPEFLGDYEIKGEFVSSQGYKVIVIGGKEETDKELIAVFVADGILYQLRGKTSIGDLKRIIRSLQ